MEDTGYSDCDRTNVLIAACFGSIITPLMSTMMNLALVHIGQDFAVGSRELAMVNTVFLLACVVFMVPIARLASIRGMRCFFILGLIVQVIAAILAIFSPSFVFLLVMRFLLGVGSAAVMVTGMTMIADVFPLERRGWAVGVSTTVIYMGLALGPTLGGLFSDAVGWRALFGSVVIFAIPALYYMSRFRGEITPAPNELMDWRGAALWMVMIMVLMYGVMNVAIIWGPPLIALGVVLSGVMALVLRRTAQPVLNQSMFGIKVFRRSCIAAFMNYGVSYAAGFFMALYLQSIGQLNAAQAGLLMLVQPAVQVLLTARLGALSDRLTDKRLLPTFGMIVTALGAGLFLAFGTVCSFPLVVAQMAVLGLGIALFSAPNTAVILSAVAPPLRGQASGMVAVVRQTGMMVSMGIAMACIAVIMGSTDHLTAANYEAFVTVIHTSFAICLGMSVVGAVVSWFRGKPTVSPDKP